MMMRPTTRRWALLALAALLFATSVIRLPAIDAQRQEYKLAVIPVEMAAARPTTREARAPDPASRLTQLVQRTSSRSSLTSWSRSRRSLA